LFALRQHYAKKTTRPIFTEFDGKEAHGPQKKRLNFGGNPDHCSALLVCLYWRQRADERFGDPPPRWIQEPSVVRDRDGRPQEDPLPVHCFCVCSGSELLGDLLGVSRSMERDLPFVLSIYPRIFLCIFIVYCRVVRILCLLLYSVIC